MNYISKVSKIRKILYKLQIVKMCLDNIEITPQRVCFTVLSVSVLQAQKVYKHEPFYDFQHWSEVHEPLTSIGDVLSSPHFKTLTLE